METVVGFVLGDISVNGGVASNLVDNGNGNFSVTIDPAGDGNLTIDVAAAVANDAAGIANLAAAQFVCWTPTRPEDGVAVSEIVAIEIRAADGSARASSRTRAAAERTWSRLGIVGEAEVADMLARVRVALRR